MARAALGRTLGRKQHQESDPVRKIIYFLVGFLLVHTVASVLADDALSIPAEVQWIYVVFQDPNTVARGSGDIVGPMTPQEFLASFESFKAQARAQGKKLIITAQSAIGTWENHDRISYKGEKLRPARYFNPGTDRVHPGLEIPLD